MSSELQALGYCPLGLCLLRGLVIWLLPERVLTVVLPLINSAEEQWG